METLEPLLKDHPFFRYLAPGDIQWLTGCTKNVRFEAGQVIFREGEDADQLYLIRDGRVALEVFTPRGPAPILTISAGEALGWSWLIPPYKWRFDARAIETTLALALDGKCLREKCDEDPLLGYELLKRIAAIIAERLHATRLHKRGDAIGLRGPFGASWPVEEATGKDVVIVAGGTTAKRLTSHLASAASAQSLTR